MSKVVALPEPGYNAQVVQLLTQLLEEAKRGDIISIVVVSELKGGVIASSWSGSDDLYKLAGGAARLQHVLQRRIDQSLTKG